MKLIMKTRDKNELWGEFNEAGELQSLASDNPTKVQKALWDDLTDQVIGSTVQVLLTHALIFGIRKL